MFDRPQRGEKTILVHIGLPRLDPYDIEEFQSLALSAGAQIVANITTTKHQPDAKYFIGSGKLAEISQIIQEKKIQLVLVDQQLSPGQERNIEKFLNCRVLDRTGLILDIFAQRARTYEGKLQVELAQLQHLATRLVRGWTHLERQKGGIGLRGPGETQLETDRRLIKHRIDTIKKRLEKVLAQREQSRRARVRADIASISLVGYTNAGKSSLFNVLTNAEVYAKDQLFATLDPTIRRLHLPVIGESVLIDTVGFIRRLPHSLVEAFRATLEETVQADLLLHVIDVSDPERHDNIKAVHSVLEEIKAHQLPTLEVYNKIDLTDIEAHIEYDEYKKPQRVFISAQNSLGLDLLKQAVVEKISAEMVHCCIKVEPKLQARILAYLHSAKIQAKTEVDEYNDLRIELNLPVIKYRELLKLFNC